ncbi:MAG TPA: diguanylate cyclase [Candidatus Solibacter sp.]|nr:diguanylate cyclase [Candidatus Solibacter sp.]
MILQGTYDSRLVVLSALLAMLASYAALDFSGRVTASRHWHRVFWLAGGSASMGLGIWAMHYVGMLAFNLPVPVFYHYPTVILSLLAAIAASAVALFTVSRPHMGRAACMAGAVVMGAGIAGMHYIGMDAMRLPATMTYRWDLVAASIVIEVVISLAALLLAFHERSKERPSLRKFASAFVMGSAILVMHYTGMAAVQFHSSSMPFSPEYAVHVTSMGLFVISATSVLILAGAILTAFIDRLITVQKGMVSAARDGESRFHILAEAIPQIVWTAGPDGGLDYCNDHWSELTGLSVDEAMGDKWSNAVHPDDLPLVMETWKRAMGNGSRFEMEYRLRDRSGEYRWYLSQATPMRDASGVVTKWFGACTDIDDQRHNQQILEQQIKERTEELADANTRLQEEMWEKDLARRQLDEQNEKMMSELTERTQRATMLAKMGELMQSCVSKDEVFAAALGFAPKIFPTRRGALFLLNGEHNLAEVAGSWNDCGLPQSAFEIPSCWALRTGHPHLVVAGDTTAPCAHALGVKNTYLCIPVLAQGEALGILHFQATDEHPSLDTDFSLKNTFAGQVGLSIANIRLREALRTQSIRDPLTGLFNRRYLEEMMAKEARRAVRASYGLGILILDLDHFKKFNDTYGHDAGDAVLRETAVLLSKSVRAEDIVCRFGGEEFVIVLPMADLKASQARAERIRTKMSELAVLHQGQSLGKISLSIGVAALPDHGTAPKELLELADAALYRAKREGRDRVVVADLPAVEETQPSPAEVGRT